MEWAVHEKAGGGCAVRNCARCCTGVVRRSTGVVRFLIEIPRRHSVLSLVQFEGSHTCLWVDQWTFESIDLYIYIYCLYICTLSGVKIKVYLKVKMTDNSNHIKPMKLTDGLWAVCAHYPVCPRSLNQYSIASHYFNGLRLIRHTVVHTKYLYFMYKELYFF